MTRLAVLVFCITVLSAANARYHNRRTQDPPVHQNIKDSGPSLVIGVMASSAAYYPKNKQQEKFVQDIIERYIPGNVKHDLIAPNDSDTPNKLDFQSRLSELIDSSIEHKDNVAPENLNYFSGSHDEVHHDHYDHRESLNKIETNSLIQNVPLDSHIHSTNDLDIQSYQSSDPNASSSQIVNGIPIESSYNQQSQGLLSNNDAEQNHLDVSNLDNLQSQNKNDLSLLQAIVPIQQQNPILTSFDNSLAERVPDEVFDSKINEMIQADTKNPSQQIFINENNSDNSNSPQHDNGIENILNSQVNEINDEDESLEHVDVNNISDDPSEEDSIGISIVRPYDSEIESNGIIHLNRNLNQHFERPVHHVNENVYSVKNPLKPERNPCSVFHIIVLGRRSMCRYPEMRYQF